jgi:hypothetical protein
MIQATACFGKTLVTKKKRFKLGHEQGKETKLNFKCKLCDLKFSDRAERFTFTFVSNTHPPTPVQTSLKISLGPFSLSGRMLLKQEG